MKIVDIRPSLASWPKRIYDWSELPEQFRPALESWKADGMPMGNITYIPKIHLASDEPEFAAAWWGDQAMIQVFQNEVVEPVVISKGSLPAVLYEHQSLKCKLYIPRKTGDMLEMGYAQVKEDQLAGVINTILGQPGDRPLPLDHPDDSMNWLLNTTLMYHPSILCRRFDDNINDCVWFRSTVRILPFLIRRRPHPEYFLATMDKGFVVIDRNFYRKRVYYYKWEDLVSIKLLPHQWKKFPGVTVKSRSGLDVTVPLIESNYEPVSEYLGRLKAAAPSYIEIDGNIGNLYLEK